MADYDNEAVIALCKIGDQIINGKRMDDFNLFPDEQTFVAGYCHGVLNERGGWLVGRPYELLPRSDAWDVRIRA